MKGIYSEGKCDECGTPLMSNKCYYCERTKEQPFSKEELARQHRNKWSNFLVILGTIGSLILGYVRYDTIFSFPAPAMTPEDIIISEEADRLLEMFLSTENSYVCHHLTFDPDVTTVSTIETYGITIVRWIQQDSYTRNAFIDIYLNQKEASDEEIRAVFESYNSFVLIEGVYWELVSVDEHYVIADFILDYENMSKEDLDQLWESDSSGIDRFTAIAYLERHGATCVRE